MRFGIISSDPLKELHISGGLDITHLEIDLTKVNLEYVVTIKERLLESNATTSLHIPWDYCINISSEKPDADIQYILRATEILGEINGDYITLHLGHFKEKQKRGEHLKYAINSLNRILEKEFKTKIAIENVKPKSAVSDNCFVGGFVEEFGQIFDEINDKRLVMCYDVGHAAFSWDIPDSIKTLRKHIHCLHIHDNNGTKDHIPIGEGNIDWKDFAKAIGLKQFSGPVILEIFDEPYSASIQKIRKLCDEL